MMFDWVAPPSDIKVTFTSRHPFNLRMTGDAVGHMVEICRPGAIAYEVRYSGFLVAVRSRAEIWDNLQYGGGAVGGGAGRGRDQEGTMGPETSEMEGKAADSILNGTHEYHNGGQVWKGAATASAAGGHANIWAQMAAAASVAVKSAQDHSSCSYDGISSPRSGIEGLAASAGAAHGQICQHSRDDGGEWGNRPGRDEVELNARVVTEESLITRGQCCAPPSELGSPRISVTDVLGESAIKSDGVAVPSKDAPLTTTCPDLVAPQSPTAVLNKSWGEWSAWSLLDDDSGACAECGVSWMVMEG